MAAPRSSSVACRWVRRRRAISKAGRGEEAPRGPSVRPEGAVAGGAGEAEGAAGAELLGEAGGAEVEAAAEEAPGAGDDDGADAVVPGGGAEGGRKVCEEVAVDGVGGGPGHGGGGGAAPPVL